MIYPEESAEKWAERFHLKITQWKCTNCGEEFSRNVPILMQGMAGLSTPIHACGEGFSSTILTPYSEKAESFWNSIVGAL
jgi:hypothetical protein